MILYTFPNAPCPTILVIWKSSSCNFYVFGC